MFQNDFRFTKSFSRLCSMHLTQNVKASVGILESSNYPVTSRFSCQEQRTLMSSAIKRMNLRPNYKLTGDLHSVQHFVLKEHKENLHFLQNYKGNVIVESCSDSCDFSFSNLPDLTTKAAESTKRVHEEGQITCLAANIVEVKNLNISYTISLVLLCLFASLHNTPRIKPG